MIVDGISFADIMAPCRFHKLYRDASGQVEGAVLKHDSQTKIYHHRYRIVSGRHLSGPEQNTCSS